MRTRHSLLAVLALGAASVAFAFDIGGALGSAGKNLLSDPDKLSKLSKGATGISLEEEISIGDSVAVEIVSRYGGVWRNTVAMQRVNLVGLTLARYALRQDLDWRFGLLDSDAVNAFSAPGGRVFITKGLYKLLENDDELAAVLAHEIAHIDRRHAMQIIAGGQVSSVLVGTAGETASANSPEIAAFDDTISTPFTGTLTTGYGSGREFDADMAGYELSRIPGFTPEGLRTALNKVEANTAHTKETFNTHPKTSDRLKKLPGGEKKKGK